MVFLSTILAKTYAWHSSSNQQTAAAAAAADGGFGAFLSTAATAITNRSIAAAFSFGFHRQLRLRMFIEEVCMGCFLIIPIAILIGHLTIRCAICGGGNYNYIRKFLYIRPDVWTTIVIAIVGDLLLEFLIPSLQCLPLLQEEAAAALQTLVVPVVGTNAAQLHQHRQLRNFITRRLANEMSYGVWLQQTWGFSCPQPPSYYYYEASQQSSNDYHDEYNSEFYFFRQRSVAVLLGIRLAFLCLGVYIGESFVPVALTGGIACGKSTVAQLLLQRHHHHTANSTSTTNTASGGGSGSSTHRDAAADDVDREGTFCIIDADSIAHEILLPPHVLATNPPSAAAAAAHNSEFCNKRHWTVQPHESVYHAVLNAFSAADNNTNQEDDGDDNDSGGGGGGSAVVKQDDADGKREKSNHSSFSGNKKRGAKKDTQQQQQHHFLLDNQGLIDRTKLGTIVFHNAAARRRLGAITHPQIFLVMMKRIIHCIYFLPIFSCSWVQYPTSSLLLLVQYFWPFHSTSKARTRTNQHLRHHHHHLDDDDDDDDDDVSNNNSSGSCITTSTDVVCVDVPLLFESGQLCWLFALVICVATTNEDLILQRLQKRNPEWTKEHCRARIASQMPLTEKMRRSDFVIVNNTNSMADLQENVERVRMQVVQRIYGILGLTLMQMLILVSASLISILLFSPTPSSSSQ